MSQKKYTRHTNDDGAVADTVSDLTSNSTTLTTPDKTSQRVPPPPTVTPNTDIER